MSPQPPLRSLGPHVLSDGQLCWRVWAPSCKTVDLLLYSSDNTYKVVPMFPEECGYFAVTLDGVEDGRRYAFRLEGQAIHPDPASLWQPNGVHQPSAVVRTDKFTWTDQNWRGRCVQNLVIYELHCGTFTPAGTLDAVIPRLPELVDLGVTAIELMPVAQFSGERNWGYDGVYLFAVHNSYGGPHALQRLVNACHQSGLAVILDVVYNHLGPEGNYLERFGPYFTDRYRTPWGPALNYDGPGSDAVRHFICDNVRMWLEEYHIDGLRLDAVHAIYDMTAQHILSDIRQAADEAAKRRNWPALLIAESNLNDPRLVRPRERGGYQLDAAWNDDYHHAIHAYYTGERQACYMDFGQAEQIAKAWQNNYVLDGIYSKYRRRRQGAPAQDVSGEHFVVYLQNHDLVANRSQAQRLVTQLPPAAYRQVVCLVLSAPFIPMLFMGEEYGEENPFYFFTSFEDASLATNIREGRCKELARLGWIAEVPDPQALETFQACKLAWDWQTQPKRQQLRRLYRDLLRCRKLWPAWHDYIHRGAKVWPAERPVILQLWRGPCSELSTRLVCNLTGEVQTFPLDQEVGVLLFSSEWPRYGGGRLADSDYATLLPWECVIFGPREWRHLQPEAEGEDAAIR